MIFSIVLMLLVLLVAYWHFLQGFFSALISTILAAVAVLVSFSYFEPVIDLIHPGRMADDAHGAVLISLFALTYIILRLIFDTLVSGNARLPSTYDKVGGAVMGIIAGILVAGLIAVAAQALPFGPVIAGYARYRVLDKSSVGVPTSDRQMDDRTVYDELASYSISRTPDDKEVPHDTLTGLPVDDMVLGFVYHSSDGGSTAGSEPFARIHPDYLQELFGNRIGIELGAKRSAQPIGSDAVGVLGVYTVPSIPQADAEFSQLRKRQGDDDKLPKSLTPDATHAILVVRMVFKNDAADAGGLVRFSTGTVRLVAQVQGDNGQASYRQYFPLGTVEGGKELMVSKPDDFLFVPAEKAADFLFLVDLSALPDMKTVPLQIAGDSPMFIEAKRYGRESLAGQKIDPLQSSDAVAVMRKKAVMDKIANASPEVTQKRLVGAWRTVANDKPAVFTYNADGTWIAEIEANGQAMQAKGTWKFISSGPEGMTFDRSAAGGAAVRYRVNFVDENTGQLTEVNNSGKPAITMDRKR